MRGDQGKVGARAATRAGGVLEGGLNERATLSVETAAACRNIAHEEPENAPVRHSPVWRYAMAPTSGPLEVYAPPVERTAPPWPMSVGYPTNI